MPQAVQAISTAEPHHWQQLTRQPTDGLHTAPTTFGTILQASVAGLIGYLWYRFVTMRKLDISQARICSAEFTDLEKYAWANCFVLVNCACTTEPVVHLNSMFFIRQLVKRALIELWSKFVMRTYATDVPHATLMKLMLLQSKRVIFGSPKSHFFPETTKITEILRPVLSLRMYVFVFSQRNMFVLFGTDHESVTLRICSFDSDKPSWAAGPVLYRATKLSNMLCTTFRVTVCLHCNTQSTPSPVCGGRRQILTTKLLYWTIF